MVGIVIVSHSAQLAAGVKELADQMVQGQVPLATAGGVDDPDNPIGTDAVKVHAAIEEAYQEDGVIVMMDLGSALLSAEMALDFLDPDKRKRVQLCAAPLVEGTMAAAVQAMVGGTIEQVMAEARSALAVKISQLSDEPEPESVPSSPAPTKADAQQIELIVRNRMGLHARPAAQFVTTANRFQAEIQVHKGEQTARAKSINQVATLGVRQGDTITISAAGPDAAAALTAIQALADDNFGEKTEDVAAATAVSSPAPTTPPPKGQLSGIPASPGIAIGPVFQYRPRLPEIDTRQIDDPESEWQKLETAVHAAHTELQTLHANATKQVGAAEAAIFEAHQLIVQDPDLLDQARAAIFNDKINAAAAWQQVMTATADRYRTLEDAYMQARAADVVDVSHRVLRHLLGEAPPVLALENPAILAAADLTPSDTAQLDPETVLGIITELGGATSHSAILSRALGIPAIVGAGPALADIPAGQTIAIDGAEGRVWLKPDAETTSGLKAKREAWLQSRSAAQAAGKEPAITQDGRRVEIAANIGGPHDTAVALEYGAEGVGLFRTEFLFMKRDSAPSEEEQYQAYHQVAEAMGERPLIIRTLDVGGDKPLPYFELGHEENPFLGLRGIRFCLDHPDIFKPQLRAILRASAGHNVKLMFPMIGAVSEFRRARTLLAACQEELRAAALPFDEEMEVGLMIEVPSAVAVADLLAAEADFFSIGTNDLTQYVMAADRGNARVADLAQALQPAVLRMIRQTAVAAQDAGIWVGMCGELAGNAQAAPLLLGLGLDELSMSAPAIPAVKAAIRNTTLSQAQALAEELLALDSAEAVQQRLAEP